MGKMNFSNYEDCEVEEIHENQIEVISTGKGEIKTEISNYELEKYDKKKEIGQVIVNVVIPIAALCDCVKVGLKGIEIMQKCIAAVAIEKQRTEQTKAMYKAQIIESKEQTARII